MVRRKREFWGNRVKLKSPRSSGERETMTFSKF